MNHLSERVALCAYISVFFFKQKTSYEMRISDWSSDVCSSDLAHGHGFHHDRHHRHSHSHHHDVGNHGHHLRVGNAMAMMSPLISDAAGQIGRASCRERV